MLETCNNTYYTDIEEAMAHILEYKRIAKSNAEYFGLKNHRVEFVLDDDIKTFKTIPSLVRDLGCWMKEYGYFISKIWCDGLCRARIETKSAAFYQLQHWV